MTLPRLVLGLLAAALSAVASGACASAGCGSTTHGILAVVIDDLGYSRSAGQLAARLPAPVTLAVIPGTPHGAEIAREGLAQNKEIMLHLPMSSTGTPVTDPLVLTEHLTDQSFDWILEQALGAVPGVTGVNNHMGSRLTANPGAMRRLMTTLRERNLYFIDSRTSAATVAAQEAQNAGVPYASRSVFLDNDPDATAVAEQFDRAVKEAQIDGSAIAIGHPHDTTLTLLRERLVQLPTDVVVVPASQIASCQGAQRRTSIPRDAR